MSTVTVTVYLRTLPDSDDQRECEKVRVGKWSPVLCLPKWTFEIPTHSCSPDTTHTASTHMTPYIPYVHTYQPSGHEHPSPVAVRPHLCEILCVQAPDSPSNPPSLTPSPSPPHHVTPCLNPQFHRPELSTSYLPYALSTFHLTPSPRKTHRTVRI
jgi:hypothetical protein